MTTVALAHAPNDTRAAQPAAWGAIYAMTLCTFVLVASEFMPVSLLSPIADSLHLSPGQAGQAIAISGLSAMIASLSLGRLIDGVDRRLVLIGLAALLIVSGALVSYAPNYAMLMLGRAVLGLAIGGFWSMSAAIAMRLALRCCAKGARDAQWWQRARHRDWRAATKPSPVPGDGFAA